MIPAVAVLIVSCSGELAGGSLSCEEGAGWEDLGGKEGVGALDLVCRGWDGEEKKLRISPLFAFFALSVAASAALRLTDIMIGVRRR